MNVYIVTEGCYSDYRIVAVFSSEALANAFISNHPEKRPDDFDVETYTVNDLAHSSIRTVYMSRVFKDGTIIHGHATQEYVPSRWTSVLAYGVGDFMAESSVSQEHADKLVIEARQAELRGRAEGAP